MEELITKRHADGYDHFYLGDTDVTGVWMEFFSSLPLKYEKDCVKVFKKFYPKYKKLEAKFAKDYHKLIKQVAPNP